MEVLNSLFSILIIILLGISSRKTKLFSKEHVKTLSSFVYYFGLPALFFSKIAVLDLSAINFELITASLLPIFAAILLLYLGKATKLLNKDQFVLYSLSVAFGSYAFFGIAFFETLKGGKWLSYAVITASILGIIGIPISIALFEYANKKKQSAAFLLKIIKNPLILSILFGLIGSLLKLPTNALVNALDLIGKSAGGIAIFALGIFLYDNFSLKAAKSAVSQSLFRMISLPLLTWLLLLLGISDHPQMQEFLFLQSGIPAAISLVVFAERYDYKLDQITGMVLLTSIFSFVELLILSQLAGVIL